MLSSHGYSGKVFFSVLHLLIDFYVLSGLITEPSGH